MHHAASRTTAPADQTPIEEHPHYSAIMWQRDLEQQVLQYDLDAARWVSGLLARIMSNPQLKPR